MGDPILKTAAVSDTDSGSNHSESRNYFQNQLITQEKNIIMEENEWEKENLISGLSRNPVNTARSIKLTLNPRHILPAVIPGCTAFLPVKYFTEVEDKKKIESVV